MAGVERARPWLRWLNRIVGPRWPFLLQPPFLNAVGFVCVLLALLVFALSPLPGGENIAAAAVLVFGLALTAEDGLLAFIGLLLAVGCIGLVAYFWADIVHACISFAQALANAFSLTEIPQVLYFALAAIFVLLALGSLVRITMLLVHKPEASRVNAALGSLATWWTLLLILSAAVLLGPAVAAIIFASFSLLGLREYRRLARRRVPAVRLWWLAFLAVPIQYLLTYNGWLLPFWTFVPIWTFVILLITLLLAQETGQFLETAGVVFIGLMLLVFLLSHAVLLFALPAQITPAGSAGLLLYLVVLTELNDIAQALWGRTFGRHKITPRVSPNKTWEGFLLGATTTVAAGVALAPYLTPFVEWKFYLNDELMYVLYLPAVAASLLIAVGGFFGDLTVSAVKREVGVKDSGDMLPGQGGILDRIDSLTFTAPLFFYFTYALYR
jgi:phosphatidate cytidylyltransferase